MEKASWHHESKLLSKALKEWIKHHNQYHKNKVVASLSLNCENVKPLCCLVAVAQVFINVIVSQVMKRQGIFLLRLKMYQTYFDQWKVKVCCNILFSYNHLSLLSSTNTTLLVIIRSTTQTVKELYAVHCSYGGVS